MEAGNDGGSSLKTAPKFGSSDPTISLRPLENEVNEAPAGQQLRSPSGMQGVHARAH